MQILVDSYTRSVVRMEAVTMPSPPATARRRHAHFPTTTTTRRGGSGLSLAVDGGEDEEGVVVILGATGTGKSKLSVDIGARFPSEVVNSDKMQLYSGFDITTNKMTTAERKGVPHHLLGELEYPLDGELSPMGFRSLASRRIAAIRARRRLPVVAGGSNSFVHSLLTKRYDPKDDPFGMGGRSEGGGGGMSYRSCLLWVDVEWEVLAAQLDRRVEDMVTTGMVDELAANYNEGRAQERIYKGVEMAIGIPEFDRFFMKHSPERWLAREANGININIEGAGDVEMRKGFKEAVEEIKENTRVLARRQREKIERLREVMGWEMRRVDATEAVRRKLEGRSREEVEEVWGRDVVLPAIAEVTRFVGRDNNGGCRRWWRSELAMAAARGAHQQL